MDKPIFTTDQVVPDSQATEKFAEVCRNAKGKPQFTSGNNSIDSVVLSYDHYGKMYVELEHSREVLFKMMVANRMQRADGNPERRYTLQDVMGEDEYAIFQNIDPNTILDEELFG